MLGIYNPYTNIMFDILLYVSIGLHKNYTPWGTIIANPSSEKN